MIQWIIQLPLYWAKICAAVLFIIIIIVVWSLPRHFIYQGSPDGRKWRDLRIWATILILLQLVLYAIF